MCSSWQWKKIGAKGRITAVSGGDVVCLIGVEPDLAFSALEDRGSEPFLKTERNHKKQARAFLSSTATDLAKSL